MQWPLLPFKENFVQNISDAENHQPAEDDLGKDFLRPGGLPLLYLQVVLYPEYARDAICPDTRDVPITLISYDTLQRHMSVLHDDVNRGDRTVSITRR